MAAPAARDYRHILLFTGVAVLCIAAMIKATADLGRVLSLEATGALDFDTLIYFTVARGILNGLKPYVDLFESKPPGMFLLAALSLLTTQGPWLATVLDIGVKLSLPAMLVAFAASEGRKSGSANSLLWLCSTAFLLGATLTQFLVDRVGAVQTEGFGAFLLCLYALHVVWNDSRGWTPTLVRSLLLMLAIGLKEPFVFAAFSAALLTARDMRDFWRAFVLPLLIAGVLGLVALCILGYAHAYLAIYLPAMVGKRITNNPVEPLFVRSFSVAKVLYNVTIAYRTWGFGALIGALWVLYPLWRARRADLIGLLLVLSGSVLAFLVLRFTWVLSVFFHGAYLAHLNLFVTFVYLKTAEYFALLAAFLAVLHFQRKRGLAWFTLVGMAATLPVSATVGIAGYALQHWAFACASFFALALAFVRYATAEKVKTVSGVVWAIVVVAVLVFRPWPERLTRLRDDLQQHSAKANAEVVRRFDNLLDTCGIQRYAGIEVHQELAFARHSPIGPLFIQKAHEYLGQDHPLFLTTYRNMLDAEVLVLRKDSTPYGVFSRLLDQFNDKPPACAQGYLPIGDLDIRFRTQSEAATSG